MNDNMVGGVVHYRITADDAEFRSSINSADRQAQGFADTLDSGISSAAQKGFSKAADSAISFATSAVNAISGVVDSVNSMVNGVQSAFERISGINLPSPSSDYLTGAMSTGVQMASTIEGATKGIALMTKDTARAEKVMDSVVDKATKTTFNVANLLQYTQQIGSAAGGDYEGALDAALAYGGAMVAAGNGLRDMGLVVRNIQQGYARGYNSVDLRQMKTYIPQFKQVMEMAGLTDEMIIDMGVDGAKAVTQALNAWVDAENIWEEYEFTYGNLKESLNEMLQTVTYEAVTESGLFDAIKNAMIQIKNNMPILKEGLKDIGSYVAEIVRNVDWAGVLRGVASGIRAIVNTVSVIWKVVSTMLKALGGGDIGKGIERFIPLLTTATIGVKALRGALNTLNTVKGVFGVMTKGAEGLAGATGKIAKVGGGGAKALSGLTSISTSVLAFVAAIWVLTKIDMSELVSVIPKLGIVAGCMLAMEALAKVASKLKVSKAQVKNLTMLAAPIATFAAALWLVDKAIPNDLSGLIPKLGLVAGCIVAMGLLALAAKAVKITVTQIMNLTKLAIPLAVFAAAIWLVDKAIPDDFGNIAIKLAIVGVVIVALGALCAIATALSEVIIPGAIVIGIMGIALAAIGAGIMVAALGLAEASNAVSKINLGNLVAFTGILGVVSILLALITAFAVFGAIGAIAAAIIGGGLLVAAAGLATAQEFMSKIDLNIIMGFMGVLTIVSIMLALITGFAIFGAIGAIASAIIGGGLALTALGLKTASDSARDISQENLNKLLDCVTQASVILAAIMPLAILGAVSSIATSIIGGGLVATAKGLLEASNTAAEIKLANLVKLERAIEYIAALQTGNLWDNLVNMVNTGILTKVADNVRNISETLANVPIVKTSSIRKIKAAIEEFASIGTGDLWNNISNLINSGMLVKIAENARLISETFSNIKPIKIETVKKIKEAVELFSQIKIEGNGLFEDKGGTSDMLVRVARNVARITDLLARLPLLPGTDKIERLKDTIHNFSQIKIEGNGLFENKGEAAAQLYTITGYIYWIARRLNSMPELDSAKIEKFVTSINKFKDVTSKTRDGIKRLSDLGDSLSNVSWVKNIFGDVPEDLEKRAGYLVNALKKFSDIDEGTRKDIREFNNLGDSLGNIDWAKKIFGDIPTDLAKKAETLVTAVKEFKNIDEGTRKNIRELNNLGDSLGNIDWLKKILWDVPGGLKEKVSDFVSAIKEFKGIDAGTRKSIRELNSLGDSLGNIDWIKKILGDIPNNKANVKAFVESILEFKQIDNNARKSIMELKSLGDALGNIDWLKKILGDIPENIGSNVENFIKAISKFKDIDEGTRKSIRELNSLGDALGNIDWLKKILVDLKANYDDVEWWVKAVNLFGSIDAKTRAGFLRLKEMGDSLGNIDWMKHILSDLKANYDDVEWWIKAIKLFSGIDDTVRAGIMRLASLGDSLGNIDWAKKILGDLKADWTSVGNFVGAIQKFSGISDDVRAGILRLATLGDSLGNLDWIKHIFGDVPEDLLTKAGGLVDSVKKFSGITEEVRAGILRLSNLGDDTLDNITSIKSLLSEMPEKIVENAQNLVTAINKFNELKLNTENLATVADSVKSLVETVKETLADLPNIMTQSGTDAVNAFISGFSSKIEDAKNQGISMANALKDGLLSVNSAIKEAGYAAQGHYWQAIQEKMNDEYYQGQAMGLQFRQGLYDVDYANSGWWAVQGFIDGANNRNYGGAAWWAGYNIAKDFLNGLKAKGEEGSPWKTTFRSGQFAGEGFALGIESSIDRVEEAMEKMANVVNTELDTINPSITTGNVEINGESASAKPSNNVKNMTINNNIYNDLDLSSMMSRLRWEMARA